jgi:hypothetical protein
MHIQLVNNGDYNILFREGELENQEVHGEILVEANIPGSKPVVNIKTMLG